MEETRAVNFTARIFFDQTLESVSIRPKISSGDLFSWGFDRSPRFNMIRQTIGIGQLGAGDNRKRRRSSRIPSGRCTGIRVSFPSTVIRISPSQGSS